MRWRTVLAGAGVAAVAGLGLGAVPARAAGPACDTEKEGARSTQAPTLTQTFTPSGDVIANGWEIELAFADAFAGELTSRIMFSPAMPLPVGVTLDGYEAGSATTAVTAAAGERKWVRFDVEGGVAPVPLPLDGTYGISLDFEYPNGPIRWVECGTAYDGGAMHTSETFLTAGAGLPGLPTIAKIESSDVDLTFRIH